ncbi:hypothetical protein BFP76_10995 [Amylibacter kogurei]|uniref:Polysaccharide biosynthesis protein C-terminal domain-containing protein n=1 Tax=Paramylibacter kogurei TaxID=1889778 RepID=A0A2G5KCK8_9RHOB|nr:oligosaccharide flippase family protein [Amylibacter kogurei]PIB26772.1 hypothetical protein BFP76_10995 [Amylibacter kogurei]
MLRSILLIFSGNAFGSVMLLVRNLLIARLISVEDYGVAATFAVTMAVIEMLTTIGLHLLVVQAEDGGDPDVQAGLQGFHLLRSVLSALVLFFSAGFIANYLEVPEIAWAYRVLALLPLIYGFYHFDVYRMQRRMNYVPEILSHTSSAFFAVIVILPLYYMFGDFRVMLFSILLQDIVMVAASHYLAERPYRITLDKALIKRALLFGWPLLINNILMIGVFHGEKIIVVGEFGIASFALIALGYTLTQAPTQLLSKTVTSFFVPQLSSRKNQDDEFSHMSMAFFQCQFILATCFVLGVVVVGPFMLVLLFGDKYAELIPLFIWLALLQGIAMVKIASTQISIARAFTGNGMWANVVRVIALPFAWYYATITGEVVTVLWIGIIGEILSMITSLYLMHRQVKISMRPIWVPMGLMFFAMGMAMVFALQQTDISDYHNILSLPVLAMACIIVALVFVSKDLRGYLAARNIVSYQE